MQRLVIRETKQPRIGEPYCAYHKIVLLEEEIAAKRCIEKNCRYFGYLARLVRFEGAGI